MNVRRASCFSLAGIMLFHSRDVQLSRVTALANDIWDIKKKKKRSSKSHVLLCLPQAIIYTPDRGYRVSLTPREKSRVAELQLTLDKHVASAGSRLLLW